MTTLAHQPVPGRPPVWGPWATLGFGVLIGAAFFILQLLTILGFLALSGDATLADLADPERADLVINNGFLLVIATLVTAPAIVGLTLLFARARQGLPVRDYLGWISLPRTDWLRWLALTLLFVALMDTVTWLSGRPLIPDFLRETYTTAGVLPLYWLAVAVAAPLSEELFFRGFLFRGLSGSRIGPWGAIVFTALVWALIHTQYELFYVVTIFIGGLFIGYARWRTGSVLLAFVIHATWNLVALTETALWIGGYLKG